VGINSYKNHDQTLSDIDDIKKHIKKLFLLSNKPAKDDVIIAIAEQFEKEGYSPMEVKDACYRLYDEDIKTINFGSIKSQIVRYPIVEENAEKCPYCKNSGSLGAKFNTGVKNLDGDEIFNHTVIACCCSKGQKLAYKFGWPLWERGNPTVEDKKRGTLFVDEFLFPSKS
jgi:hypothetical protein